MGIKFYDNNCFNIDDINTDNIKLLIKENNLEIMFQRLRKDSIVWIEPAPSSNIIEFLYVISGLVEIENEDGYIKKISTGEAFSSRGLKKSVQLKVIDNTSCLYVTNSGLYDDLTSYQSKLDYWVAKIDQKDNYTKEHSKRVTTYCDELYKSLSKTFKIDYDNLILASVFHDVGKIKLPADIINKPEEDMTENDYEIYKTHITEGAKIIEEIYNKETADIVLYHHERFDGSGYLGLKGNQLSIEVSLISIADEFDYLTTKKNNPLSFIEAAEYIYKNSDKFDRKITIILLYLVKNNIIKPETI